MSEAYFKPSDGRLFTRCVGAPEEGIETNAFEIFADFQAVLSDSQQQLFEGSPDEPEKLKLLIVSITDKLDSVASKMNGSGYAADLVGGIKMLLTEALGDLNRESDGALSPTKMFLLGLLAQQAIVTAQGSEEVIAAGEQEVERREVVAEECAERKRKIDRDFAIETLKASHLRLGKRKGQKTAAVAAAAKKLRMSPRTLRTLLDEHDITNGDWFSPE
ncbi:hypothetical protein [Rhodopirellula baltica]